jgi:hypothetical protein
LRQWDLKTRIMFHVIYRIIRLLDLTYRYKVFRYDLREKAATHHPRGVFAIATWHGNSFAGTIGHAWQNFSPLCSHSKDGSMVAFICDRMGLKPVRGSSSRGGGEAREHLLAAIRDGSNPAFTVDGPKGPIYDAKPGVIAVAKGGKCAILPMCAMGERNWVLRSWDRLHIPKPFSRVVILYGEPIVVPENAEGEAFEERRQALNACLNQMQTTVREQFAHWHSGQKRIQNR